MRLDVIRRDLESAIPLVVKRSLLGQVESFGIKKRGWG